MKKVLPLMIAALLVPSAALAKGPNGGQGTHPNHGKAKVLYVLRGTLSGYSAYDSATPMNGNITIKVNGANRHGSALKTMTLTFKGQITSTTRISLPDGVTVINDQDNGLVKIRAPREPRSMSGADLAAILTALPVRQVVDQGPASTS
jgi:hypothetical protein